MPELTAVLLSGIVLAVTLIAAGLGLRSGRQRIVQVTAVGGLVLALLLAAVLITHDWAVDPADGTTALIRWAAGFTAPMAVFIAVFLAGVPAFTHRWPGGGARHGR